MGFFDGMKTNKLGQKAYNVHVQANDLNRRGKPAEARLKYEEALQLYKEAYDAGCRRSGILTSYSVLMMRFGMFAEARELMKEISAIGGMSEDDHFELRMNYSICLWRLGILDKAVETARYAGKHCKNSSYYSALGTFLVEIAGNSGEEADFEEARVLLDQAMEYDDEDAATLDNYGGYYHQKSIWAKKAGDEASAAEMRGKAIEFYERARKQKPGQITTLYALAKFAREDGDNTKAKELVDRAILHSSSRVCPISLEMLREFKASL